MPKIELDRAFGRQGAPSSFGGVRCGPIDVSSAAKELVRRVTKGQQKPTLPPARPESLELSDLQIADAVFAKRAGKRLTIAQKDGLALFGVWRAAVLRVETTRSGELLGILSAINTLEQIDDLRGAEVLRRFAQANYAVNIGGPPAMSAMGTRAQQWADHYSQCRAVLPLALRRSVE